MSQRYVPHRRAALERGPLGERVSPALVYQPAERTHLLHVTSNRQYGRTEQRSPDDIARPSRAHKSRMIKLGHQPGSPTRREAPQRAAPARPTSPREARLRRSKRFPIRTTTSEPRGNEASGLQLHPAPARDSPVSPVSPGGCWLRSGPKVSTNAPGRSSAPVSRPCAT